MNEREHLLRAGPGCLYTRRSQVLHMHRVLSGLLNDRRSEDIPCQRSEVLLKVYRRYFTLAGNLKARLFDYFRLTNEHIDELAESVYRCTACKRCKYSCPKGIDHGLVTHLARWILAEIGIAPKALVVATWEQLEGKRGIHPPFPSRP